MPHLSVMLPYLVRPAACARAWARRPRGSRSPRSVVSAMATSLKPACLMPSISSRKRKLRSGSCVPWTALPLALSLPPVFWKTRKMTNSAGRTGAMPISKIRRPFRMSSCGHGRAVAGDGERLLLLRPSSAPSRHWVRRKSVMVSLTRAHSRSSFGSKTTHCVPFVDRASRKMNSRRTVHVLPQRFVDSVRAPQTRMPRPGNAPDGVHAPRVEHLLRRRR